jgi:ribose transport system substrate-binding protein
VNPYYIAMRDSFEKNGAAAGFDVKVAIAADSDSTQLSQVQSFVDSKVCAIALNGVNSGPAAASAALAYRAGIPVFTVNVIVSPDDLKAQGAKIVQYVGADQAQGGQVMGEAVLQDLGKDAKIVVGIGGDPDQIPTNQRDAGFAKALAPNATAKVVQTVNTKVDPNISLQVITEMLQGKPDINVVFADTGPATVGAIQAIKQLGLSGKVALYGFCAADQALDATLYRGCSAQEPANYAGIVVKNVKTYLGGGTVQAEELVPVKVFTEGQKPKPGEVG